MIIINPLIPKSNQYVNYLHNFNKMPTRQVLRMKIIITLRTFARKFSNIDFFLQILPLKDDELVMSEMQKKWGLTDFVLERTCPEEHPKSEKIRLL